MSESSNSKSKRSSAPGFHTAKKMTDRIFEHMPSLDAFETEIEIYKVGVHFKYGVTSEIVIKRDQSVSGFLSFIYYKSLNQSLYQVIWYQTLRLYESIIKNITHDIKHDI